MYFSCVILFFFAVLGFLIAIVFSLLIPLMYWSCEWLDTTFGSTTGFNANIGGLITDLSTRQKIQTCVKGGNGDLMSAISPSALTDLNTLKSSIAGGTNFNTSSFSNAITTATTDITAMIDNFKNGVIPDVTDTDSVAALVKIS